MSDELATRQNVAPATWQECIQLHDKKAELEVVVGTTDEVKTMVA